jgi:hypothetical protein
VATAAAHAAVASSVCLAFSHASNLTFCIVCQWRKVSGLFMKGTWVARVSRAS